MNKNRLLLLIVGLGALVAAGLYLYTRAPSQDTPESVREEAWAVFDSYRQAAGTHDLAALKKISYQVSDACSNPATRDECNKRMDAVLAISRDWRKDEFTHIIFDKKQLVLSTGWTPVENDFSQGYERKSIYFTRDIAGKPKILRFTTPTEALAVPKLQDSTKQSREESLTSMKQSLDSDIMRDADQNGWWDFIEAYFYSKSGNEKPSEAPAGTASPASSTLSKPFGEGFLRPSL